MILILLRRTVYPTANVFLLFLFAGGGAGAGLIRGDCAGTNKASSANTLSEETGDSDPDNTLPSPRRGGKGVRAGEPSAKSGVKVSGQSFDTSKSRASGDVAGV